MGRKRSKVDEQIEGQLLLDFTSRSEYQVVQANKIISSKQKLRLASTKIIRAVIMQIKPEDEKLHPYKITIRQLAGLLNIPANNLYRDMQDIVKDIGSNPIFIRDDDKGKWKMIQWVSSCEYDKDGGLIIKLNDELQPYLLRLKSQYTQYQYNNIFSMRSVYSIRMFELILEQIHEKVIPKDGLIVKLSVQYIKECLGCEDNESYAKFSNFRARVIESSVKEINKKTFYSIDFSYEKSGRSVTGIIFYVNMKYNLW